MTGKQIRGHMLTFSQDIYTVTVTSYLTVSFPVAYVVIDKTLPQNKELFLHFKEDRIFVFPEMKLRGLIPYFQIHVSVSDLYIPTIGPPILLQQ
jgi:hypothetical protein